MPAYQSTYTPLKPLAWVSVRAVEMLTGFVYWLVFLLVLEPGNILRAQHSGHELTFAHEALRITAAACLGTIATPLTLRLSRHFFCREASRRTILLLGAMAGLSVLMILASCFLAAWIFEHAWLPTLDDIASVLTGNGLLVTFALLAQGALDHVTRPSGPDAKRQNPPALHRVVVKTRGRQTPLDLATVEWIESQGNYLALHVGDSVHLIRQTMADFTARLDPTRFVRVHRSAVVAVEQIANIETFDNGDGILHLRGGATVKLSRNYRKSLRDRWA